MAYRRFVICTNEQNFLPAIVLVNRISTS